MSDNSDSPDRVTVIKEGGSGGAIVIGIVVLLLIAIGGFWLMNHDSRTSTDASISAAANKVGNAAEKVGNAADDSTQKK